MLLVLRKSRPDEEQDPEVESYYKHLEAELDALPPDSTDPYKDEIGKIRDRAKAQKLTWDDLLHLELLLLHNLPAEKLVRKSWMIRERYQGAAGSKDYREYLRSKPPAMDNPPQDPLEERKLRADLEVLVQDLFWRYRLRTIWEEKRKSLFRRFALGYALVVAASVPVLATWKLWNQNEAMGAIFTLLAVAVAGAGGGFISMLQRLQSISDDRKRAGSLIEMEHGSAGLVFQALITGGVFATVLLLMMGSGLVTGVLFPTFKPNVGFVPWLASAMEQGGQFAMLLLWSFLAGFAERLVPDFLDRLAKGQRTHTAQKKAEGGEVGPKEATAAARDQAGVTARARADVS